MVLLLGDVLNCKVCISLIQVCFNRTSEGKGQALVTPARFASALPDLRVYQVLRALAQ
jgi:hypothetical protein